MERLVAWLHHFRRLVIGREYHVETFFGVACLGCKQITDIYETSSNRFSIFGITLRTAWSKHRFQRLVICIPKKFQQTTRPSKRSLGVASVCDILLERETGAWIH